jgi:hypothetical protein
MSRSPSFVVGYLIITYGYTYHSAYNYVKQIRPQIYINPGFRMQLKQYADKKNGSKRLIRCLQISNKNDKIVLLANMLYHYKITFSVACSVAYPVVHPFAHHLQLFQ